MAIYRARLVDYEPREHGYGVNRHAKNDLNSRETIKDPFLNPLRCKTIICYHVNDKKVSQLIVCIHMSQH